MQRYGTKKTATRVAGHQDCGTCHPPQKSHAARARREGQQEAVRDIGFEQDVQGDNGDEPHHDCPTCGTDCDGLGAFQ